MTQTSQPIASKDATPASDDEIRIARLAAEHYGRPASDVPALIAFERYRAEQAKILGMHGLSGSIPAFIAGFNIGLSPQAAAEPVALIPKWEGEFKSFTDWLNHAQDLLTSPSHRPAVCIDAKGRRCTIGKDFMLARDEDAFPVRFFWEFEPVTAPLAQAPVQQKIVGYRKPGPLGSEFRNSISHVMPVHRKNWIPVIDAAPVQPVQQEAQDLMKQKAAAFDEWIEKTNWVQEKINTFHVKSLGKHRADVMRDEIERLRAKDKP